MARIAATAATAVVGATVFTSRTGKVARTVVDVEHELHREPLIHARRFDTPAGVTAMVFAVRELWVEAPR